MPGLFRSSHKNTSRAFLLAKNMIVPSVFSMRPGHPVYLRRGRLGALTARIPAPLKALSVVAGLAAASAIISPSLLILVGFPALVGGRWWWTQRNTVEEQAAKLHLQRWKSMSESHLQSFSGLKPESHLPAQKLAMSAQLRVLTAFENNEQQIALKLAVNEPQSEVQFGELESLTEDHRMLGVNNFQIMTLADHPLFVRNRQKGTVRVTSIQKGGSKDSKSQIEIILTDGSTYILQSETNDQVIEGSGRNL